MNSADACDILGMSTDYCFSIKETTTMDMSVPRDMANEIKKELKKLAPSEYLEMRLETKSLWNDLTGWDEELTCFIIEAVDMEAAFLAVVYWESKHVVKIDFGLKEDAPYSDRQKEFLQVVDIIGWEDWDEVGVSLEQTYDEPVLWDDEEVF